MLRLETVHQDTFDLLKILSEKRELDYFALAGGTALALFLGHRISIDLDFFTTKEFSSSNLAEVLDKSFTTSDCSTSTNTLTLSIIHKSSTIKLDFIRHNYPVLQPIIIANKIRFYSLEDIAAMKLNAITNRGAKKDFYDIHALLEQFSINEMLCFFEKKYRKMNSFTVSKSLVYFDDADLDPPPIDLANVSWEEIKRVIQENLRHSI